MKDCTSFEQEIAQVLAGELCESALLSEHLKTCSDCRRVFSVHDQLDEHAFENSEVSAAEFSSMRRAVQKKIRKERSREKRLSLIPAQMGRWLMPVGISLAMLAIGFALGRGVPQPQPLEQTLLAHLESEAQSNRFSQDAEKTPFTYNNIQLADVDAKQIRVSFDLATHLDLVTEKGGALANEILVQSLLNEAPINSRLKAIRMASRHIDEKVKRALLYSLENDEHVAVRLKAMKLLANHVDDQVVEEAITRVLKKDADVPMRLQALDILVGNRTEDADLDEILEGIQQRGDTPLMIRVREADLN